MWCFYYALQNLFLLANITLTAMNQIKADRQPSKTEFCKNNNVTRYKFRLSKSHLQADIRKNITKYTDHVGKRDLTAYRFFLFQVCCSRMIDFKNEIED